MKKFSLVNAICFWMFSSMAQEITLTSSQIETMFLEQNLELIAEQMNISIADAAIAEAKVWDNPEISINDIHVWRSNREKQFSLELTQMVSLSARRAKLANVEKVGKEMAIKQFEELLRGLKMELRTTITELIYQQQLVEVIETHKKLLEEVIAAYQNQYEKGNVTRSELIRLQMALFVIGSELNDSQIEYHSLQKTLKNLLAIDPSSVIMVIDDRNSLPSPLEINTIQLIETALLSRPDLLLSGLKSEYHKKEIIYQRSLIVPDVSLGITYDRYGGVWENFVGVGMGLQVPIFNRNKGAIKKAQIQLKQNNFIVEQGRKTLQNEVMESYQNYANTYAFLEQNLKNPVLSELDQVVAVYIKNLLSKNISIVEYLDFMDSYRSTREMLLKSQKELRQQFEQLQFSVGRDVK